MVINELKRVRRPDPNKVICPACTHDFVAIPENIQAELTRLRAANEELEKVIARMTGETREILGLALADSKCGAEDDFFTVATECTECTEGKCWHIKARAALSRAEQAKPEVEKCVYVLHGEEVSLSCRPEEPMLPVLPRWSECCPFCGKRIEVKK